MTNPDTIEALLADITAELRKLEQLTEKINQMQNYWEDGELKSTVEPLIFYESLSLKLHNFYTGCERIFRYIASDLNGGIPSSSDWHRRLLQRMEQSYLDRPPVITEKTSQHLKDFLGFRHVVRNLYGYELEEDRLKQLLHQYPSAWSHFQQDILQFCQWLRELKQYLESNFG